MNEIYCCFDMLFTCIACLVESCLQCGHRGFVEKIKDYACIGNGRSTALISCTGSMDWLCWPRFDSPSLFGKILDPQIGGYWKIAPRRFERVERAYIEETNVLQTHFFAASNVLCLTDFMIALSEEEKQKTIQPEHELIRQISCEEGEIEVEIQFNPRPEYGKRLQY